MAGNRDKKLVYHLTAIKNLISIKQNGLLSRRSLRKNRINFKDVADSEILDGRSQFDLDAMVPFHFIHKSPFDYAVVHANPKTSFALLCVRRTVARAQGWKIIARHPLSGTESIEVHEWDDGIDSIDWSQMDRDNRDYDDHECKMVCMAEALSPTNVAFSDISNIFTASEQAKDAVLDALGVEHSRLITVNPSMFPRGCK
ncbi:DUF4433 domain-containing protein [Archangium gephyra]|uniref:DarT ssDNA thymidine ADP-ribosyltransferase family protein n=1 Tax=Archangium gephyra TaxID=48 RepID=UPI0035D42EC2